MTQHPLRLPLRLPSIRKVTDDDRAIATLILAVFRPRMDVYAKRIDTQAEADELTAWHREHTKAGDRP